MTTNSIEMRLDVSGFRIRWSPSVAAMARDYGDWPDRTVADFARDHAEADPGRIRLVDNGRPFTTAQLYNAACKLAGWLDANDLVAGDVISFQLPNWWEATVVNLAAAMIGLVVNPIVPINRDAEVTYMLGAARSKVIFIPENFRKFDYPAMMRRIAPDLPQKIRVVVVRGADEEFETILRDASPIAGPREVDANAVKLLLYTSGTTGRPKGVLHTHNSIHADGVKMVPALGLSPDDRTFSPSPVTHVSGFLWTLNVPWLADIPAVTMDIWDPARAFDLLEDNRCTFALGATPFLQDLVAQAHKRGRGLPLLRQFLCGGASVPPSLIREAAAVFENCIPWRNFGASEAITMTRGPSSRDDLAMGAETDGRLYHCRVKIVDIISGEPVAAGEEGEILALEPSMAVGYVREEDNADAYDAEGYFRMGDIGRLVHHDHLVITGRKKDLIIRAGENISAREIEDAMMASGLVADVAVVSMPSARTGEAICAFVVAHPAFVPDLERIASAIRNARLAPQKTPEHLIIVAELPRTASGKVRKDVLRDQARSASRGDG